MREDTNWFAKWEEELPSPEELMPLSQTLITPDLAAAFEITTTTTTTNTTHQTLPPPPPPPLQPDFDSADEPARTLKRPRLVWTPQLHKRFVDAVAHLGIKNAVPKTIMQLMNVDGLTRENVASHLQKYRLYLKRMQGLSSDSAASACDHLFATTPVPHFLHHPPDDHHLLPFVAPPPLHHHHHHHHVAAAVHNHQQQHFGGGVAFGSPPAAVQFDHRYLTRHHQPLHRIIPPGAQFVGGVEELGSTSPPTPGSPPGSGRKVLTLFPTAEG